MIAANRCGSDSLSKHRSIVSTNWDRCSWIVSIDCLVPCRRAHLTADKNRAVSALPLSGIGARSSNPSSSMENRSHLHTHQFQSPIKHQFHQSMTTIATFALLLLIGGAILSPAEGFSDFHNATSPFLPSPGPEPPRFDSNWQGFGSPWDDFRSLLDAHKGQIKRCEKLPQLKRYLQEFGYTSWEEFTPDFDNQTEAAIKLYQSNFGLNATGTLDERTITQMMKPRCGAADVVDGISAMARRRSNSSSSRFLDGARGTVRGGRGPGLGVRHYSFFPNSPKWESRQLLTYAIDASAPAVTGIAAADLSALFADAFASWAAVVPINFTEIPSFALADIRIIFAHGEHGDGRPFDGILGVLGHGFSPEDGRLHFDAAETWALDVSSSSSRSAVDLKSVAIHEIGHILGLGHSALESAVMYPNIGAREVKLELHSDDIEGAQMLYGANPNYDPNARTETRSQPENGIPSSAAFPSQHRSILFTIAIALFVFLG
ncbi:metalloendoproteinase 1-MMP [Selaginella moellendorffii]|uniref:metalloendoproteinase 1-MMP n=1 Tax=Selaginella moellendorffii TaxID=88036 RepID=UPI000D1C9C68|nr:metalloendoproteinase 1-MMP [Selaginella moellendorffii]|eukprot:XP_002993302.2 metalloendoproteinase 1-MMP [Selaginella moellendorffii]